jgi:hypothetical protein
VLADNPFYPFINRIYQQDIVSGYACGGDGEPCDPDNRPYYRPVDSVTRQQMAKFIDNARNLPGIHIEADRPDAVIYISNTTDLGTASGIYAECNACPGVRGVSSSAYGVFGYSPSNSGVWGDSNSSDGVTGFSNSGNGVGGQSISNDGMHGISNTGTGVSGHSTSGTGVLGTSDSGDAVAGISTSSYGVAGYSTTNEAVHGQSNSGTGVFGYSTTGYGVYGSSSGWAGYFQGNVNVTGALSAGVKDFKIDDPLDPANKYLYHTSVESPDMMDIYNGNVTTDANGEALVSMPAYFEALNRDYRYQLTVIGQFAQAIVAEKIKDNHFVIKTDKPNVEVSWQVTGIRQDGYANAHRTLVEAEKPAGEKGKYLYPTELGQPASLGVDYEQQQKMEQGQQRMQPPPPEPQGGR